MNPFSVKSRSPHQGQRMSEVDLHIARSPAAADQAGPCNRFSVLLTKGSTADKGVIGA